MRRKSSIIYSRPTTCVSCHLVVEMVLSESGEAWDCPRCRYRYKVKYWKIRKGGTRHALDHRADAE